MLWFYPVLHKIICIIIPLYPPPITSVFITNNIFLNTTFPTLSRCIICQKLNGKNKKLIWGKIVQRPAELTLTSDKFLSACSGLYKLWNPAIQGWRTWRKLENMGKVWRTWRTWKRWKTSTGWDSLYLWFKHSIHDSKHSICQPDDSKDSLFFYNIYRDSSLEEICYLPLINNIFNIIEH